MVENINQHTGQIAIYKQAEIGDISWVIRVFSPFSDPETDNPHIPEQVDKEVRIILPQDKFN